MLTVIDRAPLVHPLPAEGLKHYNIVAQGAGTLAIATMGVLRTALGPQANMLLYSMASTHRRTYEHCFRTGVMGLAIAAEAGLDEWRTTELVTAEVFHDIGKNHRRILPLVDFPGYFNAVQRHTMKLHAPMSEYTLRDLSAQASQRGDTMRAHLFGFDGQVAGDHHTYDLLPPMTDDPEDDWRWEATMAVQITDRADSLTSAHKDRPYRRHRQREGDGGRDGMAMIEHTLQQQFGSAATEPFPILGLSPRDITEIALLAKTETYGPLA